MAATQVGPLGTIVTVMIVVIYVALAVYATYMLWRGQVPPRRPVVCLLFCSAGVGAQVLRLVGRFDLAPLVGIFATVIAGLVFLLYLERAPARRPPV